MRRARLGAAAAMLLAGCSVGPDYVRPEIESPPTYKELAGWKLAEPGDTQLRGAWWEVFGDPALNDLEVRADAASPTLAAAVARYAEARALVAAARANYFPTITIGAGATRGRTSQELSGFGSSSGHATTSNYVLPLDASWEIDLWGRVRRAVEASQAEADASGADLGAARLSLEAELATDFFELCGDDSQIALLEHSVSDYERSLAVTQNRYTAGVASRGDVLQAQTLLEATRAQVIDESLSRAQVEHAIAVLVGTAPAEFSLPAAPLDATPPGVPVSLPSALLEQRPDIAAAERRVAEANAQIGFQRAAYFPSLTLSASAGFESDSTSKWFTSAARFWSVGPSLSETVFDGGLRGAASDQARAAYEESVANYRQSALVAFQETEDALAALGLLEREAEREAAALVAADESVRVATNQYRAGTIDYLTVVVVETAELNTARASVDISSRRMVASVGLIKSLGGSWQRSAAPTP